MTQPTLRDLQLRLRSLIARPGLLRGEDLAAEVAALGIRGDERLSAADRVQVYADMYFVRLRDALAEDFPALAGALGDERFATLVRRYVDEHPSDRPSLRDLGRHLPDFVARHPDLLIGPWQAELAQLEWAMVEAFDALDQPTLRAADLDALPADAWPGLHVAPVASLKLLACDAPVDVLRDGILAGNEVREVAHDRVLLRVWRQSTTVFQRRMQPLEAAALRWMLPGVSFAELCAWLGDDTRAEDPASAAMHLLALWLEDELLIAPG
jgi:hypothetical protein